MTHKQKIEKRIKKDVEHHVAKVFKVVFKAIAFIGLFLLAIYVLMRLWNWLMPDLFGLGTITYWQALGILVLAKIIFGFGGGDSGKSGRKKRHKNRFGKKEKCSSLRRDFSEWKLYDDFWETEGEAAFKAYIEKRDNQDKNEEKD